MKVLRDPRASEEIDDAELRALVDQRFAALSRDQPYDPDLIGIIVVAEPGDNLEALERRTGCAIGTGSYPDTPYGHRAFRPAWEYLDEHPCCYEMVFVLSDSGYGVVLYVPKQTSIDPVLLRLCAEFATPAPCGEVSCDR
ncbi:hypothetical protein [Pseudomonas zhanjiangensis]|uniref:Uncharacterized protein n=1 Tax=Pseudomonas zhanjiangensis TaxID=3239015 RepID=A0ABV3YUK2_9PSED